MQEKIHKLMEIMGFTDKKARLYLALLEAGEVTVTELAKKSKLKRTTVYNIMPELQQDGLVKTTRRLKKKFYYIDDVRSLERVAEEKMSSIRNLLPELKVYHNILSIKPKITLYEGEGGMKQLYQDILNTTNSGDEILTYIGLKNFDELIPEEVLKEYVSQRIKKKIVNKVIATHGLIAEQWKVNDRKELRETRINNSDKDLLSGDMKIFGHKTAFLSYKENFFGVVIESVEISKLNKSLFNVAWNSLK